MDCGIILFLNSQTYFLVNHNLKVFKGGIHQFTTVGFLLQRYYIPKGRWRDLA